MLLGAHVSISGGLDQALDRGQALGATAIQTFASSPRTIHFSPIPKDIIDAYHHKLPQSGIKLHLFHGVYLINLAHESSGYVDLCVESLKFYQQTAGQIGGLGTIFHVGSHKGLGLDHYISQITQAISTVLKDSPKGVWLLLENAAGHQGTIGQKLAELQLIIESVKQTGIDTRYLGIGLDSQHAFASGYDLRSSSGLESLITDVTETVGLDRLQVIHLNDSLTDCRSGRDRHANLGEGLIGLDGIRRLVNHEKLCHLPMILEVPGEKAGPRPIDVETLKSLITVKG